MSNDSLTLHNQDHVLKLECLKLGLGLCGIDQNTTPENVVKAAATFEAYILENRVPDKVGKLEVIK